MTAHPKRWLILFIVLAAECMDLLDGTVVNVAAPTIHLTLGASSTALQWIVGGYALALAVGLLIGGRLGDLLGRRTVFLAGTTGFTVASAACGAAPSTGVLIAARLAQGLAGALMIPQGFGLLRETFPPDELPKAFGFFGPAMGSAAMIGPILGGALVSAHLFRDAWRSVFIINLPIGIATGIAAARLLPRTSTRHANRLDLAGGTLAAIASLALIYPLIQGRALGWPTWTYASIAASLVLFAAFAIHLQRRKHDGRDPLIEPSTFAHRGYSTGALVLTLYFGAMTGSMLALTLFLQLGEGLSAIHAGLTIAPFALGTAITAPTAAGMIPKLSGRTTIQAGSLISLVGYTAVALILTKTTHVSTWGLFGPLLVIGIGMGPFVVSAFDTIIATVTDRELGSASGALNAIQQLGGAIGIAIIGTIFFTTLPQQRFAPALQHAMWYAAAGLATVLIASPLLPARARPPEQAASASSDTVGAPQAAPSSARPTEPAGAELRPECARVRVCVIQPAAVSRGKGQVELCGVTCSSIMWPLAVRKYSSPA
jgi:EmrB/QacA subfamily drug resistance transporter